MENEGGGRHEQFMCVFDVYAIPNHCVSLGTPMLTMIYLQTWMWETIWELKI